MQRFTNILCSTTTGTVESHHLERIVDLARRNGARLTFHSVITGPNRIQTLFGRADAVRRRAEERAGSIEVELIDLASRIADVDTSVTVGDGEHAGDIIDHVLSDEHDLVIIANSPLLRSPMIRRLMRNCPCPVWVLEARPGHPVKQVLAAVNPSPDEEELNATILQLASSMADRLDGELHIVHAWQMYSAAADTGSGAFSFTPPVSYETLRAETESIRRRLLASLIASQPTVRSDARVHLEHGPADDVLSTLTRRLGIDLLVLGTAGRSGPRAMLIGNTAERVLDDVNCSVLAVKPPDLAGASLPDPVSPTSG